MKIKRFLILALCGFVANATAHRYFFSLTDLSKNEKNQSIEIIHQISAHDIDNIIAQAKQIHFSVAHPNYDDYIRQYVEEHFKLAYNEQALSLAWVGLEVNKGYVVIYQEVKFPHSLSGLTIFNNMLIDNYAKQINTVNYQGKNIKGSLTFSRSNNTNAIEKSSH